MASVNRIKLIGIHFDGQLNFDYRLSQICEKASKKLHAKKTKNIYKSFCNVTHFVILNVILTSYCPLMWMFRSWALKLALKLLYNDTTYLSFDDLLIKDQSLSIYQRNLQLIPTESFSSKWNCT